MILGYLSRAPAQMLSDIFPTKNRLQSRRPFQIFFSFSLPCFFFFFFLFHFLLSCFKTWCACVCGTVYWGMCLFCFLCRREGGVGGGRGYIPGRVSTWQRSTSGKPCPAVILPTHFQRHELISRPVIFSEWNSWTAHSLWGMCHQILFWWPNTGWIGPSVWSSFDEL